jgi:hypothetical protein
MCLDPPKKRFKIPLIQPLIVILIVGIFLFPFPVNQDTNQIIFNFQESFTKTYGESTDSLACSLVQTIDGGFALLGEDVGSSYAIDDLLLVKTDASGNMIWEHTYGNTGDDQGNDVIQTVDGGFAIAGYTTSFGAGESDMWLVKTDTNGVMIWNQTFGKPLAVLELIKPMNWSKQLTGDLL